MLFFNIYFLSIPHFSVKREKLTEVELFSCIFYLILHEKIVFLLKKGYFCIQNLCIFRFKE